MSDIRTTVSQNQSIQTNISQTNNFQPTVIDSESSDIRTTISQNQNQQTTVEQSAIFRSSVVGLSASLIGLGNVDNTSDLDKPISIATQDALDLKADIHSPTFTGTVSGITAQMVGLGSVNNTSDLNKPISTATSIALNGKQPVGNYATGGGTATGINTGDQDLSGLVPKTTTVNGHALSANVTVTKSDIGLSAVDNTSDENKPVSTATSTALSLKANIANPIFTGTVTLAADPTSALHAATKEYVDNLASGIVAKPSVLFATSSTLDATYTNGVDGVGAKLTSNVDGTFTGIGVDGITIGTGVLVKNQTSKAQNGRYFVSNLGSPSTRWVLTRCGFCDEADEIPGAYIFVQDGAFKGSGYVLVVADPPTFTVGVDNIDVFQFSGAGTYTAANGVVLNDNQFSADATIARLDGPTFTGVPSAPTAAADTNTTQIATTAYAKKEADDAQAAAVQRANHTGTQDVSTITGLGTLATQNGTFSGTSSGTNTGDETESTIKTKLGITTLSGSNTGDQDLSGLIPYTGATGAINLGSNNLTVDTNTLFVDAANNRVGIGTITPTAGYSLDVTGAIRSTGNLLLQGSIVYLNSQQALTQGINSLTLGSATYFTSLAYGNASTTKHTFGSGNVGISNANPTEKLDVTGNILASGTANRLPNQLASTSDSIITRSLGDLRYLEKNPVTEDTLSHTTEQFEDFDKYVDVQTVGSLSAATAFGSTTFGVSQLFANQISPIGGWSGNDRYTWNGAYFIRLSTASNQAGYLVLNRVLNSDLLSGTEITYRFMLSSTAASTSYFKIGPVPFGGTGGGDQSLRGGLVYNPALFGNGNLYIAASTSTAASPFTFTTTIGNVHYVDTGFNYTPYLDKWINITYRWQVVGSTNYLRIIIKRDNVTLYDSTDINLSQAPYSTWTGSSASTLYSVGASRKLGFAFGTITYTSRQELFIDYVHEKITHTAAWTPPSNWNSLRF